MDPKFVRLLVFTSAWCHLGESYDEDFLGGGFKCQLFFDFWPRICWKKNESTLDEQIFFKDGWFNHQPSFSIVQPLCPLEVGDSCKRSWYLKVRTTSHSEHPRCFKRRGVKRKNILRQEPSRRRARGFHHKKWWGWWARTLPKSTLADFFRLVAHIFCIWNDVILKKTMVEPLHKSMNIGWWNYCETERFAFAKSQNLFRFQWLN